MNITTLTNDVALLVLTKHITTHCLWPMSDPPGFDHTHFDTVFGQWVVHLVLTKNITYTSVIWSICLPTYFIYLTLYVYQTIYVYLSFFNLNLSIYLPSICTYLSIFNIYLSVYRSSICTCLFIYLQNLYLSVYLSSIRIVYCFLWYWLISSHFLFIMSYLFLSFSLFKKSFPVLISYNIFFLSLISFAVMW